MRLVDSRQMQEMDRSTIEEIGVPGMVLMENAARSWIAAAEPILKNARSIVVFCGAGNNGGDGYAIARNLANRSYDCLVVAVKAPKSDDCRKNAAIWAHYGKTITWEEFRTLTVAIDDNDVIVDSILGTGIDSDIRGSLVPILGEIDRLPARKIAVDIASGINASTGDLMGVGIRSDLSITFQKEKVGHHLYPGKQYTGSLICQKISILEKFDPTDRHYYLVDHTLVRPLLPKREPDGYKNMFGHLATWCGSSGTMGASFLASLAGLKTGVGLTTAALPAREQNAFLSRAPELMSYPQEEISERWLNGFDALVVGCGLGRNPEKWKKVQTLLQRVDIPTVIDADGFYGIENWNALDLDKTVLTPHPGEFARLSGFPKPKNNSEKINQGLEFIERFPTTLVLKGAPSLVFDKEGKVFVNGTGNSGMATAGSGDVLAGIVGGLLAQGLPPLNAALLGNWLHGKSGDLYRDDQGEESLTATSLIDYLAKAINALRAIENAPATGD
ncbi:MAG: NAD(P)H-hydrate dehydratase [Proteobacteria bacterium]|nr:NAD(P)H-hydrate dehydratase [Pseudomonadota bacterium]